MKTRPAASQPVVTEARHAPEPLTSDFQPQTSNFKLPISNLKLPDRTFAFALGIVGLCRELDRQPGVPRTLARQLLRSGTSVGANVEESRAGQSRADFASKLSIAAKEARETHYWLRLLVASGMVDPSNLTGLLDEANQLVAILTASVRSAKSPVGGQK